MQEIATQLTSNCWVLHENQQVFDPSQLPARIPHPEYWTDEQMQRLFRTQCIEHE